MGKKRNDLLWLAIVGLTEHYLLGHLDKSLYADCRDDLKRYVQHLNTTDRAKNEDDSLEAAGEECEWEPSGGRPCY